MSKELELLTQSTSVADLPAKMEEAEASKTEVEAMLLERVIIILVLTLLKLLQFY